MICLSQNYFCDLLTDLNVMSALLGLRAYLNLRIAYKNTARGGEIEEQ